jgi:hypothetical protein
VKVTLSRDVQLGRPAQRLGPSILDLRPLTAVNG